MRIIGAGMAGLLAANYFRMLKPVVYERNSALPLNHEALLRFRTDKVSQITGVEFREVEVRSEVFFEKTLSTMSIKAANRYSAKVADGFVSDRSIWNAIGTKRRFLPPPDFVSQLALLVDVKYEIDWKPKSTNGEEGPIISTMPIFALMKLLDWPHIPEFNWSPIWVVNCELVNVSRDLAQTIYFPGVNQAAYRASIMNGWLTVEFAVDPQSVYEEEEPVREAAEDVMNYFGLPMSKIVRTSLRLRKQEFGKIVPTEPDNCREFIYTATRDYGIYSLGRFALWRQILLDDVADDLTKISLMIRSSSKYSGLLNALSSREASLARAANGQPRY